MVKKMNIDRWNHWSVKVIVFYLLISLFAPLLSNELPLMRVYQGEWTFPFLNQEQEYNFLSENKEGAFELYAPFRYSSGKSDPLNMSFRGPFDTQFSKNDRDEIVEISFLKRHWLGTNLLGSDLLADIIYGTRISVFISLVATIIASLLAMLLGFLAGWFGPASMKVSSVKTILIFGMVLYWFHLLMNLQDVGEKWMGWSVSVFFFVMLMKAFASRRFFYVSKWKFSIPIDTLFIRFSELFSAIPRVILVLAFIQLFSASMISMMILLALSAWVDLARIVRSELHRIKSMTYIDAAVMSGVDGKRLLFNQVLPNIWPAVLVFMMYTFAGNISIEAGLSFLGFGLPATVKTLGGLIAEGKNNFAAWWMIVFPGIWLSVLIYAMFSLSDEFRRVKN